MSDKRSQRIRLIEEGDRRGVVKGGVTRQTLEPTIKPPAPPPPKPKKD